MMTELKIEETEYNNKENMQMDVDGDNSNDQIVPPNEQTQQLPFKRRRRNMFDVKPEEFEGELPKQEVIDQPVNTTAGEIVTGPGCGGLQPRFSEAKRALPKIVREHEECLAQAKRFAMEQSVQHVLAKQKIVQQADISTLQSSTQRQRALALMCRIYIGSINFQLNEESVRASFIPFGPIKMIDLSWDAATMKHKGFAFVEYELPEAAQLALEQMNNVLMGGRNIKVGRPSSMPQAAPWIQQMLDEARAYARIYVSSIHPDLSEHDIKSVFEAFGNVINCSLAPDQMTGKHKGYGFIEYSSQHSANDAIVAMNLFDLGGQYIRVGKAITPPPNSQTQGPPPAAAMLAASVISASIQGQDAVSAHGASALNPILMPPLTLPMSTMAMTSMSTSVAGMGHGMNGTMGSPVVSSYGQSTSGMNSVMAPAQQTSAGNQPVPEEKLNSRQQRKKQELLDHKAAGEQNLEREEKLEISGKDARYMMMQKLARGTPSGVIVLHNMVTFEEIDEDLETEVTEECSRFGDVNRVIIYQEKQGEEENADIIIKIFVEFSKPKEAEDAKQALNGRWFGGRTIHAAIYDEDKYKAQDYTG